MLVPCTSRARDGLRRRPRSTNHPMSGGDAEAPPGPAHLRAREVLATFASDPTYGDLVHDDFDAAAFSNAVIVRDRDGAPGGEGGESHAEATVREVAARAATVEEAIEGHLDESRDKLIRSAKGLAALQRDVEAVEVAAKEVRRRTRAMARKVLVPFEACAAKTKRLRLVFEANRLLRRCQRALFALRRLREKVGALDRVEQAGGGVELRELGAAAALVGDVERLLDDGGEGRLRGLDVLAGEVGFVAATRDRLRATAERSLRVALDGGHLADAAAALGAAYELGARRRRRWRAPRVAREPRGRRGERGPPRPRGAVDDALERAEDGALALASKTQQIASDVTVETAKATQDLAAKTKDLVEKSKLKLAAKFHGGAAATPAEALAAHYPAARRAFLALDLRVLEKLAGAASRTTARTLARRAADDELPAVDDIDPTNDGGLLPLQMLPPDADYLGAAAKDAPPRSVVALFEAQFLAVNAEHDAGRYGPPAAGAGAASALATALAAPLRPGDVRYDNLPVEAQVERCDEVVFGNRLEMALSRHHVAPTVGRSYGPCPDNPWRTFAGAPKALAGADFTPGPSRASAAGPGEGHEAAAGAEPAAPAAAPRPPAAAASAPAPAALMFPELEGYEAAVPSKHDVAFMVDVALKEVRAALDDEPSLAPAVLGLVGGACEAFAARCGRALKRVPAARSAGFRTLGAAVDDACRGGVSAGDMVVPEVAWRASAVEERDARLVACAATLRRQAGDRLGALGVAGGADALAPGLAALDGLGRPSRSASAPRAALLRDVDDAGRAALARDVSRLDDALVDYEPEALPAEAPRENGRGGAARPSAILREGRALLAGAADGRDGRAGLRPSTVWHHCLAACGHALIPLPDALHDAGDGGDDPAPPAARARARLADGAFDDARADADGARVDREREAWLDVLRCLDTWAQRASASGVSSLGDVYDAIHQDGEVLFDEYKAAVMGSGAPLY
ncbi:hypothetical protein JL722_2315 [Aureococcus anophagefferens]|nr:hypothetical protein JL722_2315 [Aureococcus anophagefferens]